GNEGIGFAIPSNLALEIGEQLIEKGRVVRGFLGVYAQNLTASLAKQFDMPADSRGALITGVESNSPASRAGIRVGDIITSVEGKRITSSRDLMMQVEGTSPGTKVSIGILRDGTKETLPATLGQLPSAPTETSTAAVAPPPAQNEALAGVAVSDLTPALRKELKVPSTIDGAVITEVAAGSDAYRAGLRPGDVIEQIDRKPVTSAREAVRIGKSIKKDHPALLLVWSEGVSLFVVVKTARPG
ncbi:MAG: PDZ domain-containing protein, partial [Chloroflexota bacterium]